MADAKKTQRIALKLKEKKGSLLWELLIVLAILFAFLYSATMFIGTFVQFETLSYASKTVARQIEVTGRYDDATIATNIQALLGNSNLRDIRWDPVKVGSIPDETGGPSAESLAAQAKLQLRQTFTIKIYATYDLHLIGSADGSLLSGWSIPIEMSYTVTGMSEIFWRD